MLDVTTSFQKCFIYFSMAPDGQSEFNEWQTTWWLRTLCVLCLPKELHAGIFGSLAVPFCPRF